MRSGQSYRDFFIKGLIGFVIIVGGVFVGMFIAAKAGFSVDSHGGESPTNPLPSSFKVGDLLPEFSVLTPDGQTVTISDVISNQNRSKTIVAFVSTGCLPCHEFIRDLLSSTAVRAEDARVILLTDDPRQLGAQAGAEVLEITALTLAELEVTAYPTFCVVRSDGTVDYAGALYNPGHRPPFM